MAKISRSLSFKSSLSFISFNFHLHCPFVVRVVYKRLAAGFILIEMLQYVPTLKASPQNWIPIKRLKVIGIQTEMIVKIKNEFAREFISFYLYFLCMHSKPLCVMKA